MNKCFCLTLLSLLLLQVSGNIDLSQLSNEELLKLLDNIQTKVDHEEQQEAKEAAVIRHVQVDVQREEVLAVAKRQSHLLCNYTLLTGEDLPVTVTWKVGDGPRNAHSILECTGYTHASRACKTIQILDQEFMERLALGKLLPSLEFSSVISADSRNYWCQVALESSTNFEEEFDMKSVVLRVNDDSSSPLPKFHSVTIGDNEEAALGKNVTLSCSCEGNQYHCDDVNWYKGPDGGSSTSYRLVYTRTVHSKPTPTEYHAHNEWTNRATLAGNSLHLQNVELSDAGRYWCEIRSAGYKAIGEYGTDAKSMVLSVDDTKSNTDEKFDCNGQPDGAYPDINDCNKYYECVFGKTYHRECSVHTVFFKDKTDPATYGCYYKDQVPPPCGSKE